MLLGSRARGRELQQQALGTLMRERGTQRAEETARQAARTARERQLSDLAERRRFEREKLVEQRGYEERLDEAERQREAARTPEEQQIADLNLRKLQAEVQSAEAPVVPSASEQVAQKRLEIAQRKERREITETDAANMDFILNPDTEFIRAKSQAEIQNRQPNQTHVFFEDVDEGIFTDTPFMSAEIIPDFMVVQGKKVTGQQIIDQAARENLTVPEYLDKQQRMYNERNIR